MLGLIVYIWSLKEYKSTDYRFLSITTLIIEQLREYLFNKFYFSIKFCVQQKTGFTNSFPEQHKASSKMSKTLNNGFLELHNS